MTTTGMEKMADWMKYVVKSSPATPQPVPIRMLPAIAFRLIPYSFISNSTLLSTS
jgi:hypothetical protein